MEELAPQFTLITQNVDSLHQRAGSRSVVELHGNLSRVVCSRERRVVEAWTETGELPPRCPECGSYLRPDVVWFGEILPQQALETALEAAALADVFLSIGTSALVQPAASLPAIALEHSAAVVEINPDRTPLTAHVTYTLQGPAGQILPALVKALRA
jgi:NAD-dependent deacetylase